MTDSWRYLTVTLLFPSWHEDEAEGHESQQVWQQVWQRDFPSWERPSVLGNNENSMVKQERVIH